MAAVASAHGHKFFLQAINKRKNHNMSSPPPSSPFRPLREASRLVGEGELHRLRANLTRSKKLVCRLLVCSVFTTLSDVISCTENISYIGRDSLRLMIDYLRLRDEKPINALLLKCILSRGRGCLIVSVPFAGMLTIFWRGEKPLP